MASLQRSLPADVESWPAQRVVEYALGEFPGRVALACSFQKEETVLLDMLFELEPKAKRLRDRHRLPVPRDARALAGGRAPLRHEDRDVRP